MKIKLVYIIFVHFLIAGCGGFPPKTGETVYVRIVQVFNVEKFKKAQTEKTSFKGFFYKRELSMLETAMKEGVDMEAIRKGRLVSVDCSCGAECYIEFPLLLPENVTPKLYLDLLEVEVGKVNWISNEKEYEFSLAKFRQKVDISSEHWIRYQGNHERMPACFRNDW